MSFVPNTTSGNSNLSVGESTLSDFAPARTWHCLDRDVRAAFPDDESVNKALRVIAKAAKQQASRVRKAPSVHDDKHPDGDGPVKIDERTINLQAFGLYCG